ncbi:MAG: GIY-YIG nuclease family protein [Anaerolineales bacterium]|nr:GIY-YIG nuclease family protein [Anaerolineales bacterium]
MDKNYILEEIRRTAEANGGTPLGKAKFQAETGISTSDWYGKHWARWGDALIEAGYSPNTMQQAFDDDFLLGKLAALVQDLGRFPVSAELRMKARGDPSFPSHNTFRRLGKKAKLARLLIKYCKEREEYSDVVVICIPLAVDSDQIPEVQEFDDVKFGYVYLLRSGRYYKIGRSNAPGRREYEISLQLPEEVNTVHVIKTDDPAGIEEYWHRRFAGKRKGGEWFDLSNKDIAAFKRRKFL